MTLDSTEMSINSEEEESSETSAETSTAEDMKEENINDSAAESSAADQQKETEHNALEVAEKKYAEAQDQLLRLNAEFENFKRRTMKEQSERLRYYNLDFVKELLPSIDSLEKAIEVGHQDNSNGEAIVEGIEMVHKMVLEAFSKFHISRVEATGEEFDPNIHQAVGTVESEETPENHVVDVFQMGYRLHDRVVRPAMVRVCKKQ